MSTAPTIADCLHTGTERLRPGSESARLDAELLLVSTLECTRAFLHAWPDTPVSPAAAAAFEEALARRENGEPVAYITGWWQFMDFDLMVSPAVLVPRPETELLVELALAGVAPDSALDVADIGTGSGAIGIAVAAARPQARVIAVDTSAEALDIARANVARLDIPNIELTEGDLVAPLAERPVDLLLANLPYVASGDPAMQADGVRHEPRLALDGGEDGLDVFRRLAPALPAVLNPGATVLLEHGMDQGEGVAALLREAGLEDVVTHADAADLPRVTQAIRGDDP